MLNWDRRASSLLNGRWRLEIEADKSKKCQKWVGRMPNCLLDAFPIIETNSKTYKMTKKNFHYLLEILYSGEDGGQFLSAFRASGPKTPRTAYHRVSKPSEWLIDGRPGLDDQSLAIQTLWVEYDWLFMRWTPHGALWIELSWIK